MSNWVVKGRVPLALVLTAVFWIYAAIALERIEPIDPSTSCAAAISKDPTSSGVSVERKLFSLYEPISKQVRVTSGLEFEGLLTATDDPYKNAAVELVSILHETGLPAELFYIDSFEEEMFQIRTVQLGAPRNFVIMSEGVHKALKDSMSVVGVEVKSDVLVTDEDAEAFFEILFQLKTNIDLRPSPQTGGVHVHVGVPGISAAEVSLLALVFSKIREQLFDFFHTADSRTKYNHPTNSTVLDLIRENPESFFQANFLDNRTLRSYLVDLDIIPGTLDRGLDNNSALNFRSFVVEDLLVGRQRQTFEFRVFNSTLNLPALNLFRRFCLGLVKAIRTKDADFKKLVLEYEGLTEIPLEKVFEAIDIDPLSALQVSYDLQSELSTSAPVTSLEEPF